MRVVVVVGGVGSDFAPTGRRVERSSTLLQKMALSFCFVRLRSLSVPISPLPCSLSIFRRAFRSSFCLKRLLSCDASALVRSRKRYDQWRCIHTTV